MESIQCLIVDDNELDRLTVEGYALQYPFINIIATLANPLEIGDLINKIDLMIMDIDMPIINGMDFFKSLNNPPLCIFITSHPEFAVESFEAHALDYIIKPITGARFNLAINRAKEYLEIHNKAKLYDVLVDNDFLTIKEGYDIHKIRISEIIYMEALKDYTKIVTSEKTFLTLSNLKNFFEKLPAEKFIRIHRSYAVSKNRIKVITDNEVVLNEIKLPIGKTFKGNLK